MFCREARRLWHDELSRTEHHLNAIPAALIINLIYNYAAQDTIGREIGSQGLRIAEELGLLSPSTQPLPEQQLPTNPADQMEARARSVVAWGAFNCQVWVS